MLNIFTVLIAALSANIYGACTAAIARKPGVFGETRDIYYYAFGTFSVWALILIELFELLLVRNVLGSSGAICPTRHIACLISIADGTSLSSNFRMWITIISGAMSAYFIVVLSWKIVSVPWWCALAALGVVSAFNGILYSAALDPLLAMLKANGFWG